MEYAKLMIDSENIETVLSQATARLPSIVIVSWFVLDLGHNHWLLTPTSMVKTSQITSSCTAER
jgi:hypothetical protein